MLAASVTLLPGQLQGANMTRFIRQVFREKAPGLAMRRESLAQVDIIVKNLMHYFASNASGRLGRRKTLSVKKLSKAVMMSLPVKLRGPVMERAQQAIDSYQESTGSRLR